MNVSCSSVIESKIYFMTSAMIVFAMGPLFILSIFYADADYDDFR